MRSQCLEVFDGFGGCFSKQPNYYFSLGFTSDSNVKICFVCYQSIGISAGKVGEKGAKDGANKGNHLELIS